MVLGLNWMTYWLLSAFGSQLSPSGKFDQSCVAKAKGVFHHLA